MSVIHQITRVTFVALLGVPAVQAQQTPETQPATFSISKEYRAVQASALKTQRNLLLSFADSMPERLYRDKATPAQRDFAQQVEHIAGPAVYIATLFLTGKGPNGQTFPQYSAQTDTAKVLNSRAALKQFINAQYDKLDALLAGQTDADRDLRVKFFGGQFVPRWQIWDELNQHAMWTAGQVVANFRKNGMAPPSFLFF
jgi:hypothetical protein